MDARGDRSREWLEADGLGGFASGTASGIRTRRYHALLLAASTPPAGRFVLVNGLEAQVETSSGTHALSSHLYTPDVVHPDGVQRLVAFDVEPWPRWTWELSDGTRIQQELQAVHGAPAVVLRWRPMSPVQVARLGVRLLMSGRDPHSLHHENGAFRFEPEPVAGGSRWRPYEGVPGVLVLGNGAYRHGPEWYRSFLYEQERARGLDHVEDLASPGEIELDLSRGDCWLALVAETPGHEAFLAEWSRQGAERVVEAERARRAAFPSRTHRSADAYVVKRGEGKTIVAGYPWFGDWGRDTFIAMRGLCLATGRLDEASAILGEWASAVSEGMLPNRFPDRGETPEYNSVDASLWYVVAVAEYLEAAVAAGRRVGASELASLRGAVDAILDGYSRGTRYRIHADADGLLACGEPGVQLTWMDAKVGDWVVTPRTGKPVEIQALWLNALEIASAWDSRWKEPLRRGLESFAARFWNEQAGCLFDVVDVDHFAGTADASVRPNQVFAVGGLPLALLDGERARRVVDVVERRLWTPLGLRSLAPGEPAYVPRYEGGVRERDGAYHQGTVWPWLFGSFVEAWLRVRGSTPAARAEAQQRFLAPLLAHLDEAGIGHVSEIADAEPPHVPRGCPFQAWSVSELLRAHRVLTADEPMADSGRRRARRISQVSPRSNASRPSG